MSQIIFSHPSKVDATPHQINNGVDWIYHLASNDKYNPYDLSNIQMYNPLYSRIYPSTLITPDNYNSITWPNHLQICGENAVYNHTTGAYYQVPTFIKFSPLLDPVRYLVGKYDLSDPILRILPNLDNHEHIHPKISHHNNVSYIDNFMCYLSSQLAGKYGFCHGLDYYGSYLAIQKSFKYNATDDIDYLSESPYFIEHLGHDFCMDMNEDVKLKCGSRGFKHKIHVLDGEECEMHTPLNITLGVLDEEGVCMAETVSIGSDDIISLHSEHSQTTTPTAEQDMDIDTEHDDEYEDEEEEIEEDSEEENTEDGEDDEEGVKTGEEEETDDNEAENGEEGDDDTEYTSVSEETEEEEEDNVYIYIKDFPTQMICLGKCDGTLDELMMHGEMNDTKASAWLFQIVMSLLVYQKAFQFTHNDLHTNNIMYVSTDVTYIDYVYDGVKYRVPTYGKLFKIIDFGRAIYRCNGMIFCSDSYAQGGDAYTQYNCEPFFNPRVKRVDPNFSFDLCRLACSMYLFIMDYDTPKKSMTEYQRTIYRWCLDDSGKNILFKKNGEERYPDFKLYKMIARHVHQHTPENQLAYPFFNQYAVTETRTLEQWMTLGVDIDKIPQM